MLTIDIPGFGEIQLKYLICDFSGTISVNGKLVDGVADRLNKLAGDLEVHVLTADTHGTAKKAVEGIKCKLEILDLKYQDMQKEQYIEKLGTHHAVAFGNGNNDRMMLKSSRIGIAICLAEGLSTEAARAADIISTSINDALDLLIHPKRLIGTLRF